MFKQTFKDQITKLFEGLKNKYTFQIVVSPTHPGREELTGLLQEVASCSDLVDCRISDGDGLAFTILKGGAPTSVSFRAVPTGHEFSSLLLAVLNMDGIGRNIPGLEAAIDLSGIANEVTVLEYLTALKGDQILQDKLRGTPNVKIITGVETLNIDVDGEKVTAIEFRDRKTGVAQHLGLDGVFVQIGLTANSTIFSNLLAVNGAGEIVTDSHCRTNVPGIYAAGDVAVVPYKQIVIAMGEGPKAALSAFEDRIKDKLLVN